MEVCDAVKRGKCDGSGLREMRLWKNWWIRFEELQFDESTGGGAK
jgi:hypothetical protein